MMREIKTILTPVDFSAGSAWALDYAQIVAKRFDAAIHLVHVCEVPSMATASMDAYAIAYSDFSQRLGDEAERELTRIAAGIQGIKTSTEILFGNLVTHPRPVPRHAAAHSSLGGVLSGPFRSKLLPLLANNERLMLDGTRITAPDNGTLFRDAEQHKNYSTNAAVLERFAECCETCNGFIVC